MPKKKPRGRLIENRKVKSSDINGDVLAVLANDGRPIIVTYARRPRAVLVKLPENDAEADELLSRIESAAVGAGCYWSEEK